MTTDPQMSLRRIERSDLAFLVTLSNDPVVRANVVGWEFPLSLGGQDAWFERQLTDIRTVRLMVDVDGTPVGMTGLWDIDWRNGTAGTALKLGGRPDVRGRGHGTRAIELLMRFAFEDVGLRKLTSTIIDGNSASLRAYVAKSGWTVEGRRVEQVWRGGEYRDLLMIGMLRSAYVRRAETASVPAPPQVGADKQ